MGDTRPLTEAQVGDRVIIRDDYDNVRAVWTVRKVTATQITAAPASSGSYTQRWSISTRAHIGGTFGPIELPTAAALAAAELALNERAAAALAADEARRRAEYDALPESVKLGRSLTHYLDGCADADLATIPADLLRPLVEWFRDRQAKDGDQ